MFLQQLLPSTWASCSTSPSMSTHMSTLLMIPMALWFSLQTRRNNIVALVGWVDQSMRLHLQVMPPIYSRLCIASGYDYCDIPK